MRFEGSVLRACSKLIMCIQKFSIAWLPVDCSTGKASLHLNGLVNTDCANRVQEVRDYHSRDKVFLHGFAFVEKATV